jgi:hypothetical protein
MMLLATMAILALVALAAVALAITARQLRAANRAAERRMQADLLLESGFDRAAAQLARDPSYQGETWRLSAETLASPGGEAGEVEIKTVDSMRDVAAVREPPAVQIQVRAVWPAGAVDAVQASETRILRVPAKK